MRLAGTFLDKVMPNQGRQCRRRLAAAPGSGMNVVPVDAEIAQLAVREVGELTHRVTVAEPAAEAGKQA